MAEDITSHFNEKGFVIAENLLNLKEIEHYKHVLKLAVKSRKQLDKRQLSEKTEYEQSFIQCQNLWEDFQENHRSFTEKGNKAAGGRAHKAVGEVKKLVTDYRKASVTESK